MHGQGSESELQTVKRAWQWPWTPRRLVHCGTLPQSDWVWMQMLEPDVSIGLGSQGARASEVNLIFMEFSNLPQLWAKFPSSCDMVSAFIHHEDSWENIPNKTGCTCFYKWARVLVFLKLRFTSLPLFRVMAAANLKMFTHRNKQCKAVLKIFLVEVIDSVCFSCLLGLYDCLVQAFRAHVST